MTTYIEQKGGYKQTMNDIVENVFNNYLPGYWNRHGTNLQLIKSYAYVLSNISDNINLLHNQSSITTAHGTALDDFGVLFGITRNEVDDDESFRNKLLNYFKLYYNNTRLENIQQILALKFNIDPANITLTPRKIFKPFKTISIMGNNEPWNWGYESYVSADINIFYKGTQSIKLSGDGAVDGGKLLANLDVPPTDLTSTFNKGVDSFRVWYYFDDVTKIDKVELMLADLTNPAAICAIPFDGTEPHVGFLHFNKSDFTNLDVTNFEAIEYISIRTFVKETTTVRYDWLQQGSHLDGLMFDLEITEPISSETMINITREIEAIKPMGTSMGEFKYTLLP